MGNRQSVINLIKAISGQANILTIPRAFVDFAESLDGGLLLSQIVYWSDRTSDPQGWFYKTYADWQQEIGLSEYEVRKNTKRLVTMGFLETKVKKAPNGNPTVHYRLDWDKFSETFLHFLQERTQTNSGNEAQESAETLNTEITAETTAKQGSADASHAQAVKGTDSKKPKAPPHPAIAAYRRGMGRYPAKSHWPDIIAAIGEDETDLTFWEQVVRGWKLTGYNPQNTRGMLDHYRRREIPSTQPKGVESNGRQTAQTRQSGTAETPAAGGQTAAQTPGAANQARLRAHLERKRKRR